MRPLTDKEPDHTFAGQNGVMWMNPYFLSLKPIWDRAHYCAINEDKIQEVASQFISEELLKVPDWREAVFPQEDDGEFVDFLGVVNALNFCFIDRTSGEKFDAEYPRGSSTIWRGSFGMIACLKRALEDGVLLLKPEFLAHIENDTVQKIFEPVHTPMPLLEERTIHIRNVGRRLLENGYDGFFELFEESDFCLFNNGIGIVEKMVRIFESYRDEVIWRGRHHLIFAKRALLLPMMYYGRALTSNGKLTRIKDPEHFSPVLDYVVSNALRRLGILQYNKALAHKIARREELSYGSDEEVEIRGMSALAICKLLEEMNKKSPEKRFLLPEVDSYLWKYGRQKDDFLHHHTYATAY